MNLYNYVEYTVMTSSGNYVSKHLWTEPVYGDNVVKEPYQPINKLQIVRWLNKYVKKHKPIFGIQVLKINKLQ